MNILAIDTSMRVASAALWRDGETTSVFRDSELQHSRTILPLAEEMLAASGLRAGDIDCFCAVVGPGSFTGVRIGVAAVKGFGFALDKPCAGVETLEALAMANARAAGLYWAAIPARAGEVYAALFAWDGARLMRQTENRVCPDDAPIPEGATVCVLPAEGLAGAAARLAALEPARALPGERLCPCYVRLPQAVRMRMAQETTK